MEIKHKEVVESVFTLELSPLAVSVSEQLKEQGLKCKNLDDEMLNRISDSINLLWVRGLLSEQQNRSIRNRFVTQIQKQLTKRE